MEMHWQRITPMVIIWRQKKKEKERKWKTSPNKSLPAQYVCAWSLILNLLILLQLQKIWTWSSSPRFTLSHLDVFKSADGPKASHITPSGGLCSGEFQTCNSPPMQFHKQRWCLDILFLQRTEGKKKPTTTWKYSELAQSLSCDGSDLTVSLRPQCKSLNL